MNPEPLPAKELFGFEHDPFRPDPAGLWLGGSRKEAVDDLADFIRRRGFAVLTAPPGCGKTALLGHLATRFQESAARIIYVACADCGPADLLRLIGAGLDLEPALGRSRMIRRIAARVAEMKTVVPVLIIDEAQGLPHATLETLRVTCSAGLDGRHSFAVILAGADELRSMLGLRINEPLRQRITLSRVLRPLTRDQARDYLRHRFERAGGTDGIISGQAFTLLFDAADGVPRVIDKLAAEALRAAAREQARAVTLDHVQIAARAVLGTLREGPA